MRVQRVNQPGVREIRTWGAHERSVYADDFTAPRAPFHSIALT